MSFNIFKALSLLDEGDTYFRIDTLTSCTKEVVDEICSNQPLVVSMVDTSHIINPKISKQVSYLEANSPIFIKRPFKDPGQRPPKPILLVEQPLDLELKPLLEFKVCFSGRRINLTSCHLI